MDIGYHIKQQPKVSLLYNDFIFLFTIMFNAQEFIDELENDERYYQEKANKRLDKQIERDIEMYNDLGALFGYTRN